MINYILGDSLTRIRNAQSVNHASVRLCYSRFVLNVVHILKTEGYIKDFTVLEERPKIQCISVDLKYYGMRGVAHQIKILSKPGCRRYVTVNQVASMSGDKLGTYILSTSKGVLSDKSALKLGVGGELLVYIL